MTKSFTSTRRLLVTDPTRRLLLTAREAAEMLAISTRTLWTLTNRGEIAATRIGRAVRYEIDELRAFCARKKGGAA